MLFRSKTLELAPELLRGQPGGLDQQILQLEQEGLAALAGGQDPDGSLMLGGEVAGRINDMPSVRELLERITSGAEAIIRALPDLIAEPEAP